MCANAQRIPSTDKLFLPLSLFFEEEMPWKCHYNSLSFLLNCNQGAKVQNCHKRTLLSLVNVTNEQVPSVIFIHELWPMSECQVSSAPNGTRHINKQTNKQKNKQKKTERDLTETGYNISFVCLCVCVFLWLIVWHTAIDVKSPKICRRTPCVHRDAGEERHVHPIETKLKKIIHCFPCDKIY